MCGIAGILAPAGGPRPEDTVLQRMAQAIARRGPDDSGVWLDRDAGIGLAHRRLSIVDLSPAGHQPMASSGGRFVIVFNGEIYNHQKLRARLEEQGNAPDWQGHSDTETLLAAIEAWGVEKALGQSIGMFAFALWDRKRRCLTLARDRMGEKPLYYGWQGNVLLFGSELAALRQHPAFEGEIDRNVLALLVRHNYIPAPYSIYRGIKKLPPGCRVEFTPEAQLSAGQMPQPTPYWSLRRIATHGMTKPFEGDDQAAVMALEELLLKAVGRQMVADVPLGAFLSGGIDSSTIAALMQAQSGQAVKTYTIGFEEKHYDEAQHAKAVARHLGTDHTELYVSPQQALDIIPRLPLIYSEPFADASQIPTFLVSQMTRQHVTVALSGDGGDELFGGYNRYFWVRRVWNLVRRLPQPLWKLVAGGIQSVPVPVLNHILGGVQNMLPGRFSVALPGDKAHKLAAILAAGSQENIFRGLSAQTQNPTAIIPGASEPPTVLTRQENWPALDDFAHQMMYLDAMSYLPDDIMVKVDRAAMGVSLETRAPFLDHRVVEFAWRLPLSMKIRDGQGKWILRQVLSRHVPRALIERPKMGFAVPIDIWLRGPLRDWAENLLDEGRLRQEGFFAPKPIRQKWQDHLSGHRNWQYYLWTVLMFQAWKEEHSQDRT